MASNADKNKTVSDASKKPAATPAAQRLAELQAKRSAALASAGVGRSKPVSPAVFFEEAWVELKKTTWPTKDVLIKSTTVVLALVLSVAIFVGIVDAFASRILSPLFSPR